MFLPFRYPPHQPPPPAVVTAPVPTPHPRHRPVIVWRPSSPVGDPAPGAPINPDDEYWFAIPSSQGNLPGPVTVDCTGVPGVYAAQYRQQGDRECAPPQPSQPATYGQGS